MIKEVFQRTGKRSAINRARQHDTLGRADARNDRCGIIAVMFGGPAVGKRNFLVGKVDQLDLKIASEALA